MVRLRAGESFPAAREEPRRRRVLRVVGRWKRKATTSTRAGAGVRNKRKGPTSPSPDAAMAPSRVPPERAAAAVGDVAVEGTDGLDCSVCFQCKAGHAVCSVCCDKLKATGNGSLQESTFAVGCTDLSSGLPKPDECFQFEVSKSVLAGGDKIRSHCDQLDQSMAALTLLAIS